MIAYKNILQKILNEGKWKKNRTGVDTLSITGALFEHDINDGFPLLTSKKMGLKNIATELEFFIKGLTDKNWLKERKCFIWNLWSYKDGRMLNYPKETQEIYQLKSNDLGVLYGFNWRNFGGEKTSNLPNANIPYQPLMKSIDGIEYENVFE